MKKRYPSAEPIGMVFGCDYPLVIGERCSGVEHALKGTHDEVPSVVLREATLEEFLAEKPERINIGARLTAPGTRYYLVSVD